MSVTIIYQATKTTIATLELDASISEQHVMNVEVTDHPVEAGSLVSDHARPAPEALTIEGFISNTPLPSPSSTPTAHEKDGVQYFSRGEAVPDRAGKALVELLRLKDEGELVTVTTGIRTYEEMIVTALTIPRTASTGNGLRFSITLKNIRFVEGRSVDSVTVKKKNITLDKAKPKVDQEKKSTVEYKRSAAAFLKDSYSGSDFAQSANKMDYLMGLIK